MALIAPDEPIRSTFTRALRFVDHHREPLLLAYHPVARVNAFQALLYSKAPAAGVIPVGLVNSADIDALDTVLTLHGKTALHLHWTSEITRPAENDREARQIAETFLKRLTRVQARGLFLIWTVHNVMPHNCRFPDIEAWLRSQLAELADVIHIMNPRTPNEVVHFYELPPSKLITVPHPSYDGAFPTHHAKETIRFELGFQANEFILGLMGSIQQYKGLHSFRDALRSAVSTDRDLRGLVAGLPGRDRESSELVLDLLSDDLITCIPRRLADGEMARVVKALDVAVLPYASSLNSGAALLAATFGVPVIAPALGHFLELEEAEVCRTYDPSDPDGLTKALAAARLWTQEYDSTAASRLLEQTSPSKVSTEFFRQLRARL